MFYNWVINYIHNKTTKLKQLWFMCKTKGSLTSVGYLVEITGQYHYYLRDFSPGHIPASTMLPQITSNLHLGRRAGGNQGGRRGRRAPAAAAAALGGGRWPAVAPGRGGWRAGPGRPGGSGGGVAGNYRGSCQMDWHWCFVAAKVPWASPGHWRRALSKPRHRREN